MATYCRDCGKARDYPTSSVRTGGNTPCQFCGKVDSTEIPNKRKTRQHPGETRIKVLGNYSYPDHLLPNSPFGRDAEAARERG